MVTPGDETPILIAQAGPLEGQQWRFTEDFLIGRDTGCTIIIPDRQVSRRHARIFSQEDRYFLEDLQSKNGTHVNGEDIDQGVPLKDGDVIQIALAQEFVFVSADATMPLGGAEKAEANRRKRLQLDKHSRRVWIGERELVPALSAAQFRVLEAVYKANGTVVARDALTDEVWGSDEAVEVSPQALDALIRRLRSRLADVDPDHEYILTIRGHGLRLDNPLD